MAGLEQYVNLVKIDANVPRHRLSQQEHELHRRNRLSIVICCQPRRQVWELKNLQNEQMGDG